MAGFLDTNILLYSISTEAREREKRATAIALLKRRLDWTLSVQVLQEFYVQATRSNRVDAISHEDAIDLIRVWMRFRVQENTLAVFRRALEIKAAHGLSYWESAIVAAACVSGCDEIYSEDLAHGRMLEGVTIRNPFL